MDLPALTRYQYLCGTGAILMSLVWLGRLFVGEDPSLVTRIPAILAAGAYAISASHLTWLKQNPHQGFFMALLPLLAHIVHMNFINNLAPELTITNLLLLAVVSAAIESRRWSRITATLWTTAFISTAWFVPQPALSPVTFSLLMTVLCVFVFALASNYYSSRRQLQRKIIELDESQNLAQVGSWEVDLRSKTPAWSQATYKLLEWPADRPLPTGFGELVADPANPGQLGEAINDFFNGGDSYEAMGELRTASGRHIWVHSRGHTLYDNGVPSRKLGVFTDISYHMEREQALTEAKEAAEAAVVARTQFLANMSHEIRTPMNGVIGLTSLLAEADLREEEKHHVNVIRACGESLLTIINDILDFAKLDAGKLHLENTAFDLAESVHSSADVVRQAAEGKGLNLQVEPPALEWQLLGDPGRLRQVLVNLLSNAIKFTDEGTVTLSVAQSEQTSYAATLTFTVSDTGIGIPRAAQGSLFDAFTQADASTTRKYGGTGLGLSICQELVQQMGGNISVTSEPTQGASFTFTLTLPYANTRVDAAETATPEAADTTEHPPMKILLAEDNPVNQRVAITLLQKLGYAAELAANGVEALQLLEQHTFDLVLMDVQMPEMDGLEATRHIRSLSGISQPRIIALTANAMVEDRARCLQAGMDDFLAKPVRFDDLKALLNRQAPARA